MALRSLGSSLIARAGVGSRTRQGEETRIQKPEIPGKGAVGTLSRKGIEEPLERQVPPGSEKIVSSRPIVESIPGVPADILPDEGFIPPAPGFEGVGTPEGFRGNIPSGAQGQALFQGGVSTPQARSVSQPVRSTVQRAAAPGRVAQVQAQIPRTPARATAPKVSTAGGSAFLTTGGGLLSGLRSLAQQLSSPVLRSLGKIAGGSSLLNIGNVIGKSLQQQLRGGKPIRG